MGWRSGGLVQETRQQMGDPNVISLYFATSLAFIAPTDGFPYDDLSKILHGGQRMAKVQKWRRNIAENFKP